MFCMYVWSTSAGFSAAAPGFADFCCKQGQDIYPGHWPFVSHRLRATGSATPIWPLQQNCPSHRASRIIRQRFFKVFSETIRKAFVRPHVKMQGGTEPGPPSTLADPGNYTQKMLPGSLGPTRRDAVVHERRSPSALRHAWLYCCWTEWTPWRQTPGKLTLHGSSPGPLKNPSKNY